MNADAAAVPAVPPHPAAAAAGADLSRKLFTTPMPIQHGGGTTAVTTTAAAARRPVTAFKSPAVVRPPVRRPSPVPTTAAAVTVAARTVVRAPGPLLLSPGMQPTALNFGGMPSTARPSGVSCRVIAAVSPANARAVRFVHDGVAFEGAAAAAGAGAPGALALGPREAAGAMLALGCSLALLSQPWIENHWRWICWKLAARERVYPDACAGQLNFREVVRQLMWRHEREIVDVRRSALRKVLARDAQSAAYMVLCVADVRLGARASDAAELTLTDGWYAVEAVLDGPLTVHARAGRLFVGQKLRVLGSELRSCEEGVEALEISANLAPGAVAAAAAQPRLVLHVNSVRRARYVGGAVAQLLARQTMCLESCVLTWFSQGRSEARVPAREGVPRLHRVAAAKRRQCAMHCGFRGAQVPPASPVCACGAMIHAGMGVGWGVQVCHAVLRHSPG